MSQTPRLHLQVLGPVIVSAAGEAPTRSLVTQPRQLALLVYLLLARPRGLHARDTLVALLWPRHDASQARQALRNALHGLRKTLGADVIQSAGDQLVGVNHQLIGCDAFALEQQDAASDWTTTDAMQDGDPFMGFHVTQAPAFLAWLDGERARLQHLQARGRKVAPAAPNGAGANAPSTVAHTGVGDRSPHQQDAYAFYVRGNYMFLQAAHNGRFEDLDRSRENFERALALDPGYALAIAGLSNYFAVAGARGVIAPFHSAFARAIELSHAALAIDPSLAVPHVHFGVKALYLDDDVPAALHEFTAAATLDPKYAEGRRFRGIVLGLLGRHERSLDELVEAARLEPGVPLYASSLAAALIMRGDMERAEQLLREALRIDPAFGAARERLLRLLEGQGRFADAVQERLRAPAMRDAMRFAESWRDEGATGYRRERAAELRALVTTLETRLLEGGPPTVGDLFSPPALRLALAYAELGEWRKVRSWKLQACATRPGLALWFAAEPTLQPPQDVTSKAD